MNILESVLTKGGVFSDLGSSSWAYVGEFHPKWSKFGTVVPKFLKI